MKIMGRKVPRKNLPRLIILGLAGVVLITFFAAVGSTVYGIHEVRSEISECDEAIARKKSELKQLKQKKAYYESEEFLEDNVRSNGYVGEDETVFVVTD